MAEIRHHQMPLVITVNGDSETTFPALSLERDLAYQCTVSVAEQPACRSRPDTIVVTIDSPDALPTELRELWCLMAAEVDAVAHAAEPYVTKTILENLPHVVRRRPVTTQVRSALRRPCREIYDPHPTGRRCPYLTTVYQFDVCNIADVQRFKLLYLVTLWHVNPKARVSRHPHTSLMIFHKVVHRLMVDLRVRHCEPFQLSGLRVHLTYTAHIMA